MLLTVSHVTTYRYSSPVRSAVQSLRLTPSSFEGQQTHSWQIGVEGGVRGAAFRDGAGDWIESWSVPGPVDVVCVRVEGVVETRDLTGMLRGYRESVPAGAYMRETQATRADAALTDLSRKATSGAIDPLDAAHRLSAAVGEAIDYQPGTTGAHTTAAEALLQGQGVCQDHAHAMIAVARVAGLPARYVSGYLHTSDNEGDRAAYEAAHAWAEVWLDTLGWVGFDPANAVCPDDRYIRLGSGYDAGDAAPIRGIAHGLVEESLDVSVAVRSSQQ